MRQEPDDPDGAAPERPSSFEYRRERAGAGAITVLVAGVLLVVFVLQNLEDANVDFLVWEWDVSIAAAIVVAAVLGFVIGWMVAWLRRRARRT
jgi:uncharacterized integral membrane protein